jgi:hypothetical protein
MYDNRRDVEQLNRIPGYLQMGLGPRHVILAQHVEEQKPLLSYLFPLPAATPCHEFCT